MVQNPKTSIVFALICCLFISGSLAAYIPDSFEDDILDEYRPMAIDESFVGRNAYLRAAPPANKTKNAVAKKQVSVLPNKKVVLAPAGIPEKPSNPNSVFQKDPQNKMTKELTEKIMTTFLRSEVAFPNEANVTDGKDHVIARYSILIPLYVPALKKSANATLRSYFRPKEVTETHTEMIPVKKNVQRIKTILKAERVPQRVITDFVTTDGEMIPSSVDDKVKPGEQIIKTVVRNYD